MFEYCNECQHPMERHIGIVDMGGGHHEAIGCTVPTCDCMNYLKEEFDYE